MCYIDKFYSTFINGVDYMIFIVSITQSDSTTSIYIKNTTYNDINNVTFKFTIRSRNGNILHDDNIPIGTIVKFGETRKDITFSSADQNYDLHFLLYCNEYTFTRDNRIRNFQPCGVTHIQNYDGIFY